MANTRNVADQRIYHIRMGAELDNKWADWFEGFAMASRADGETLLSGPVADQAALHGVLANIHRLGVPLLLVVQADCPCPNRKCPRRGQCADCAADYATAGREPFCLRAKSKWDKRCSALVETR